MPNPLKIEGKRYGYLVVIQRVGFATSKNGTRHSTWLCKCDCGGEKVIRANDLRTGNTKSCGCRRLDGIRKTGLLRKHPKDIATYKSLWRQHKRHHGNKADNKYGWLPFKIWIELVKQRCFYCGVEPPLRIRCGGIHVPAHGIDRVDSKRGYEVGNVVPCCRGCNSGKSDGTPEEYIERCRRVVAMHPE